MIGLDDLLAGAAPASRDEALALMGLVAAAQIKLTAILADLPMAAEDRLLDVAEASAKLGESKAWLYRKTRQLPFVVRVGGHVRYSLRGIEQFIARGR
jgi:predicted DNA-binding transcriptional regulator AlpA